MSKHDHIFDRGLYIRVCICMIATEGTSKVCICLISRRAVLDATLCNKFCH
jgi:hypothetical protein